MTSSDSEDRISSLPESVREHILHFLPLKDAGKSSILSSKWRNMWMNLPTLRFDEKFASKYKADVNKLMLDICRVVFLHRGPLKELSLSLSVLKAFPDRLDQILMFLQSKRVESLTIKDDEYGGQPGVLYWLSRRLFSSSFSQLKILHLSSCQVESSTTWLDAFVKLTVLELESVSFAHSIWSFRCPLLASLSLDECYYADGFSISIEIEAPKLSCFHFVGISCSLHFKHSPVLKKATISTTFSGVSSSDLLKLWGELTSVESLSVSGAFCQDLDGVIDQADDLSPLEMLRHMIVRYVCLSTQSNVNTLLFMIRSSPNLQTLEITMQSSRRCETLVSNISFHGPSEFELSQLTEVEVKELKNTEHELGFIKWLLSSSPALDIMKIKLSSKLSDAERILILTELNGFARASTRAVIKIESLEEN